eukprot:scaffold422976_cov45-Attheya_sp.AAC.1
MQPPPAFGSRRTYATRRSWWPSRGGRRSSLWPRPTNGRIGNRERAEQPSRPRSTPHNGQWNGWDQTIEGSAASIYDDIPTLHYVAYWSSSAVESPVVVGRTHLPYSLSISEKRGRGA